jgi:hypothetical protein
MSQLLRRSAPGPETTPWSWIVSDGLDCELRIWTEAEWEALPAASRPARYAHAPGLGWVGAVPARASAEDLIGRTALGRAPGSPLLRWNAVSSLTSLNSNPNMIHVRMQVPA